MTTTESATAPQPARLSRWEHMKARADAKEAAMLAAMQRQREELARPVYSEGLCEMLSVHLRNVETLIAELRDVVDVGGMEVDLQSMVERAKALEGSAAWMVSSAAERAGLVAS